MSYLSEKLKELRTKNNISQYKLAEDLQIKRSAYGNYETGLSYPEFNTLKKIADYYKLEIGELLGYDEKFEKSLDMKKEAKEIDLAIKEYYYKKYRKIPRDEIINKLKN